MFTDSINENVSFVEDLISGLPRPAKVRCGKIAQQFEDLFNQIRQDNPRDPAAALGAAFAVFKISERIVENDTSESADGNMIQLLS